MKYYVLTIPLYWPAVISFEEFEKGDLLKVLNEDKRLVGMARAQTDSKRKEKGLFLASNFCA